MIRQYPSAVSMARAMAAFNDVVRTVADAERVPLADVDAYITKDFQNFYDDVHFTKEGA
jgi:hypothetical protein